MGYLCGLVPTRSRVAFTNTSKRMTHRRRWFDRRFALGLPVVALPDVIERLRGTPVRLEERISELPRTVLSTRVDDAWSIQENAGHLLDLEPLWAGRLEDIVDGSLTLRDADLANRKTHEAGHNERDIAELLQEFRSARSTLVNALEACSETVRARTSRHPRLGQPMSVADLFFFVAEHDDHHLSRITEMLRQSEQEAVSP